MDHKLRFRRWKGARGTNCQRDTIWNGRYSAEAGSSFRGQESGDKNHEPCQENKFKSWKRSASLQIKTPAHTAGWAIGRVKLRAGSMVGEPKMASDKWHQSLAHSSAGGADLIQKVTSVVKWDFTSSTALIILCFYAGGLYYLYYGLKNLL